MNIGRQHIAERQVGDRHCIGDIRRKRIAKGPGGRRRPLTLGRTVPFVKENDDGCNRLSVGGSDDGSIVAGRGIAELIGGHQRDIQPHTCHCRGLNRQADFCNQVRSTRDNTADWQLDNGQRAAFGAIHRQAAHRVDQLIAGIGRKRPRNRGDDGTGAKNRCAVESEVGRNHQLHIGAESRAAGVGELGIETELFPKERFRRCTVAGLWCLRVHETRVQNAEHDQGTDQDAFHRAYFHVRSLSTESIHRSIFLWSSFPTFCVLTDCASLNANQISHNFITKKAQN